MDASAVGKGYFGQVFAFVFIAEFSSYNVCEFRNLSVLQRKVDLTAFMLPPIKLPYLLTLFTQECIALDIP